MVVTHPGQPPMIAHLSAQGVTGALVSCSKCQRSKALTWEQIGLPGQTEFPQIARLKQFTCSGCGSQDISIMPSRHQST